MKKRWKQRLASLALSALMVLTVGAEAFASPVDLSAVPETTVSEPAVSEPEEPEEEPEVPAEEQPAETASEPEKAPAEESTETVEADPVGEEETLTAEETAETTEAEPHTLSEVYINPLYADIISEDDLVQPEQRAEEMDPYAFRSKQYQASYVTTLAAAGTTMREGMKSRTESITIYYRVSSSKDLSNIFHEVSEEALKHTGIPTEGDYLMWQFAGWKAKASYDIQDSYCYLTMVYTVTYYTSAAQEATMDATVQSVMDSLSLSGKTDYEKIQAIYDYICANVTYDYANLGNDAYTLQFTAYAALVDGTAVCQGYAVLFYRMALMAGVDARVITGDGGGPHAWNIVKLGNYYYNLDSTWDAGESVYSYFLLCDANFDRHIRDTEYYNQDFYINYPMAGEDYDPDGIATGAEMPKFRPANGCGDDLIWKYSSGVLTISGTGEMDDYDYWNGQVAPWYSKISSIKSIVIKEGVTTVGAYAFAECYLATSVTLPATLTGIGEGGFLFCASLKSLKLPAKLTGMGEYAFSNCEALSSVTIPSGVTALEEGVFYGCTKLTSLTIPKTVTSIGDWAYGFYWDDEDVVYSTHTISGYHNTAAETYALDNGIKFKLLLDAPESAEMGTMTYNSLQVKWASVYGATGYELYRSTSKTGTYKKVATLTGTSYTNTGLSTGTTYYYKVRAYKTSGSTKSYGGYSSIVSGKPMLSELTGVTMGAMTYNSLQVKWTKVTGASGYEIYRATAENGTYKKVTAVSSSYSSYTNKSLNTGTTYYYKVRAYRTVGSKKVYTDFVAAGSGTPMLSALTGVKMGTMTYNSLQVKWTKLAGASGYEIYRSTAEDGSYAKVTAVSSSYTSYTNKSLNTGTTYYYKVRAYRTVGSKKVYTDFVAAGSGTPILSKPTSLKATAASTSIKLTWKAVTGAQGYEILRSDASMEEPVVLASVTSKYVTYTDKTPATTVRYTYQVRAYRVVNNQRVYSALSTGVGANVTVPAPTVTLTAGVQQITVKWKAVTDASGYEVYRATSKSGTYTKVATVEDGSTVEFVNEGLTAKKTYYYKVRAYRILDNGTKVYSAYSSIKYVKTK